MFQECQGQTNSAFLIDNVSRDKARDFVGEHLNSKTSCSGSISMELHPDAGACPEKRLDTTSSTYNTDLRHKLFSTNFSNRHSNAVPAMRRNSTSSWLYFPTAPRQNTDNISVCSSHTFQPASPLACEGREERRCRGRAPICSQRITTSAVIETCRGQPSNVIAMSDMSEGDEVREREAAPVFSPPSTSRRTLSLFRASSLPSSGDRLTCDIFSPGGLYTKDLTSSLDIIRFNRVLNLRSDDEVNASVESIC